MEECKLCGAVGDDMRTLKMRYLYELTEQVPEMEKEGELYTLRTCKACRGDLLGRMKDWRSDRVLLRGLPKDPDGEVEFDDPERNIPYRENGRTVLLTQTEYEQRRKD